MTIHFVDTFTGSAVSNNALAGHTADSTTIGSFALATGSHDGLNGSGVLYNSGSTGFTFFEALNGWGFDESLDVAAVMQGFRGYNSSGTAATMPLDSGQYLGRLVIYGGSSTSGASAAVSVWNESFGALLTDDVSGSVNIGTGKRAVLTLTSSTGQQRVQVGEVLSGSGPWDIELRWIGGSTAQMWIDGVYKQVLGPTVGTLGDSGGCYLWFYEGIGATGVTVESSGVTSDFWTDFVNSSETI